MKYFFLILLVNLVLSTTIAQNENSKWYFGIHAGIDFNTSPPTALINGATSYAYEGCSSISDANGNILFYTDGTTVWNQNHVQMANGGGLNGNVSTTQSSLIVKQPNSSTIYYIFTMGLGPSSNFNYSIVDMSLAAGMGSVTVKNFTILAAPNFYTSEKLTGIQHCNGNDFWIMTHHLYSNNFYSYLLSASGVNTVPVISSVGQDTSTAAGHMKISPTGKKLAILMHPWIVAIHDFDRSTGVVSTNSIVLTATNSAYGLEFSPDGTKLYMSTGGGSPAYLVQWDLCAGNEAAINASKTLLYQSTTGSNDVIGALQLGIDNKIYVARLQKDSIGVINNPNLAGAACNYSHSGVSLMGKMSYWGLPNQIQKSKPAKPLITNTLNCEKVDFSVSIYTISPACAALSYSVNAISWLFGDPASGTANTATLATTSHTYSAPGSYTARAIVYYDCMSDTIYQQIVVASLSPTMNVSGTTTICAGEKATITATGSAISTYSWSNGKITSSFTASPNANIIYTIKGSSSNGCSNTQTIQVQVNKCLGIINENEFQTIRIYPNPNFGEFFIKSNAANFSSIFITDIHGKEISFEATIITQDILSIKMKVITSGMYFVTINTPSGINRMKIFME